MSKALYIYNRNHTFNKNTEYKLLKICQKLTPDNIAAPSKHKTYIKGKTAYAVTLTNSAFHESDLSIFLGCLYEKPGYNWYTPGANYPDGNYAIFRCSDKEIEAVSDKAGSRTIWYYFNDEIFLTSTSQRAIILFIGSFVFDKRVIPWIISTGSLGPELSWDKRIKKLHPDSSVSLNKKTWELTIKSNPIVFSVEKRRKRQHKELLIESISQTFKHFDNLDLNQWILPLSGGYDSRAILCFIKNRTGFPQKFKTVTWGLEASPNEERNDAKIAKDLAEMMGVQHNYYHTDISNEPIKVIINRFLANSEGRVDHIAGYMDGMKIWQKFHAKKIVGIIRGDEGFGWSKVSSEIAVRLSLGCALCSDYENIKNIFETFQIPSQRLPKHFKRSKKESLSAWRDRLYHIYRIPNILAALSDIKFSYIEQINPLLSSSILKVVRTLPDHLRTEKYLFKKIVAEIGPEIPFAIKGANANPKNILRTKPFIDLLKAEIDSDNAKQFLGPEFVSFILKGIKTETPVILKSRNKNMKKLIGYIIPQHLKTWYRHKTLRPKLDGVIFRNVLNQIPPNFSH